jgi:SAM-dependent methyltransferase
VDTISSLERFLINLSTLIGILVGVATLAGLWLGRRRRAAAPTGRAGGDALEPAERIGPPMFVASARIEGQLVSFVDRTQPLRRLAADVRGGRSVVLIEGVPGIGKTALAAALCRQLSGRGRPWRRPYHVRWAFCAERPTLSLEQLALGLADLRLPGHERVRATVGAAAPTVDIIDVLIGYLQDSRILVVLDDYPQLTDRGLPELVGKLAHSRTRATLVLTSRRHPGEVTPTGVTDSLAVPGLPRRAAHAFLRTAGLREPPAVLDAVWAKAGNGVPEAMRILIGHARRRPVREVLRSLPGYEVRLREWMALLLAELRPAEQELARIVSFAYEPVRRDLLTAVTDTPDQLDAALDELLARMVLDEVEPGVYEMHPLWRDHVRPLIEPDQELRYGSRIAKHYQRRARDLLRGVDEQPSYGELYLESFPDYVDNEAGHAALVDDLMARLRAHQLQLEPGARVLVLGAGHGTHDPGLARHSLELVGLDLQADVAARGMARARTLPARIGYVVADMTRPFPFAAASFDGIVNIGSSFGFEDTDEENAAVFRHAARVLKPGGVFVFEYANGGYWQRYQRTVEEAALPGGGVRTNYKVVDPEARTSLNVISLRRPGEPARYLHHFMHYYRLDEVAGMMRDAGLEPVATYGANDGRVRGAFRPDRSAAMVILATRRLAGVGQPP